MGKTSVGFHPPGQPGIAGPARAARGSRSYLHGAWLAALLAAGCAEAEAPSAPLGLVVTPLTGTACGDPDQPTANPNPFVEAPNVSIAVRGIDIESGRFETLVRKDQRLREGTAVGLKVPEGPDREVVVFARGGAQSWFGRDTGLDVTRNTEVSAAMALTRYDGFSCVPAAEGIVNTVFPAAVAMGDGRILVVGGFTQVVNVEGETRLGGATSLAWIFDPRTGQTKSLGPMGTDAARGAATAVYLSSTNQVLILGGTPDLQILPDVEFPFHLAPNRAFDDYFIFDPLTETFTRGAGTMSIRRAFARAAELSDGTVVVTGGGPWPLDGNDDFEADIVDIFDPEDDDGAGGFLDIPKLRAFYPRAGHSLSFIKNTEEGLSQLLVWGGTTDKAKLFNQAEIFKQSGRQQDGVNGTFAEVEIRGTPESPPAFTFFHETTRLSGQRFLATGGAAYRDGAMRAPAADEAWLLTYEDASGSPVVIAQRIAGFGAGRVFHTALSDDLQHVAVIGGWGPTSAIAAPDHVLSFDARAGELGAPFWTRAATAGALTAPRGGHIATLTPAGTIFVAGGEAAWDQVSPTKRAAAEVYTPAFVTLP